MRGKVLPLVLLLACSPQINSASHPPAAEVARADRTPPDPTADCDGDGFLDIEDSCANEPGLEPDGCPARDSDRDQIFDVDDDCPDAPEAVNRYHDHDGCPDEFPAGWAVLDEPVFFGVSTDELRKRPMDQLTPAIVDGLKKVAAVMRAYPELRVELIAHHDAAWKLRGKQNPSARRVLAARKFLVEREKIKTKRIRFRHEGADKPIADNTTPEGPLKNNRLEFQILPN